MRIAITILTLLVSSLGATQTGRRITGKYSNPALGYEVTVPDGLVGETRDQAKPERGFGITLSSGGTLSVFGEPNRPQWRAPIDGMRNALGLEKCTAGRQQATGFGRMGRLTATKGTLLCGGDQVLEMLLTFRPGSGPIYWMTLRTTAQKRTEDEAAFNKLAASFQLIAGH